MNSRPEFRAALVALLTFIILGSLLLLRDMTPAGLSSPGAPSVTAANSGSLRTSLATSPASAGLGAVPAAQDCAAEFELVASPGFETAKNELRGVAAVAEDFVWAVGIAGGETLIERWDGAAWTRLETPNPGIYRRLDGVAVTGPDHAWAAGWYDTGTGNFSTLLLHWGGERWDLVPTPGIAPDSRLFAVDALEPDDVWAVGAANGRPFSMHWDGAEWSIVPTPDTGPRSELNGVVAIAADDVWAVGGAGNTTLTMHWNGAEWSIVPSPNAHNYDRLYAVDALGPNDVWAAGGVILRWDGSQWYMADGELPEGQAYRGIRAFAADNVWAGGYGKESGGANQTIVKRWNGKSWAGVASLNPSEAGNQINALGGTAAEIWAVGNSGPSQSFQPLIQRYVDPCAAAPAAPTPGAGTLPPPVPLPGEGSREFPETGKSVRGIFLDYWNEHGGLAQQGFPISDVIGERSPLDGKVYTVQYFERAVFEYHPENEPPFDVLLSQLGTLRYQAKYPDGALNQLPSKAEGSILFNETGKRLGGRFLEYWQANGGLVQQGFPISDEFEERSEIDGKTYTVQYFERAVFELHPENEAPFDVLLSLLGVLRWQEEFGG